MRRIVYTTVQEYRHVLWHVPKHVPNKVGCGMVGEMANKRNLSLTRTHHLGVTGGKNYSLIIPVEFIRNLKWRERQKLNITLDGERIIIEDWKK